MDLTVVVPTQNEEANVAPLVARTHDALTALGLEWEMLFVDDSDDATPVRVREAAGRGHPVRLLHRPSEERVGGLGGAVAVGFREAAESQVVAVMDGDLQHRPEMLVPLVEAVRAGRADLAIASRCQTLASPTGGMEGWWRCSVSRTSRSLVQLLLPRLAGVRDPLAGFFALRQSVIRGVQLRPEGFKILLEVLVRGSWAQVVEIPCELDPRLHGRSKAHLDEGLAFAHHLVRLLVAEARLRQARLRADRARPPSHLGSLSSRDVEGAAHREPLGDQDHRLAGGEDPVGAEDQQGGRVDVEVPGEPPCLLLARGQDLPEGLEPVLVEELADGDGRGDQAVDQGRSEAARAQHRLGVEQVPAAVATAEDHVPAEHRLVPRNPELGDVGAGGNQGLTELHGHDGLAGVLLEDPSDHAVGGEQYPL
ncbi:MAG: glycosyltransferase [Actinomycetota bacterium]|nr:glycosyltransferase [Actinomycetota bacterium]